MRGVMGMRKLPVCMLIAMLCIGTALPAAAKSSDSISTSHAGSEFKPVQDGVAYYPKNKLADIESYTVYYGEEKIEEMSKFDLAILETASQTKEAIAELTKAGTKSIAYISVGEADPDTWYYEFVDEKWKLGDNVNWNSKFIDVRHQGWHDLVLKKMIPHIVDYGVQGLFLDTVDSVDVEPKMKDDMIRLIREIRETFPQLIIVMNRGLTIMDEAVPYVDGVMFESFSGNVDWDTVDWNVNPPKAVYPKWEKGDLLWTTDIAIRLGEWQRKTGLTVLSLDYAHPGETEHINYAYERATAFGSGLWDFVPYVSTLDLFNIYNHESTYKRNDGFRDSDGDGVTDSEEKSTELDPKKPSTLGKGIPDMAVYHATKVKQWGEEQLKSEQNSVALKSLKQLVSLTKSIAANPKRQTVLKAQAALFAYQQATVPNSQSWDAAKRLSDVASVLK
jgi:uncharacterized protein (TIGR01370 family)